MNNLVLYYFWTFIFIMQKHTISLNIGSQLLLRLLLVMVCYTISRLCFFLFNLELFESVDWNTLLNIMKGGLIFDRTAILYTNALVIFLMIIPFRFRFSNLYQNIVHWLFILCNSICFIMNAADSIYYRFTLRRTTASIFKEFQNDQNLGEILRLAFVAYWDVSLACLALLSVFIYFTYKIKYAEDKIRSPWVFYPLHLLFFLFVATLFIGGVRGGFKHSTRPITLSNASKFINEPNQRSIVLNTPFSIIRTIGKNTLEKVNYFNKEELQAHFNAVHPSCAGDSSLLNKNVVVIILESFGRANVGYLNQDVPNYTGYTPFLDSLSNHCYSFKHAFANGRKSIDALPSVIASIPSISEPFILSNYSGNAINSIASLLKPQGYYSAFFHGAPNGSMGFDAFMKQAEFDNYFGKNEYNNNADFDDIWGIWDEPFLQYFARTMSSFKEPFVSSIFTLSSHHPFKVPAKYEGVFPKGDIPLQQCIGYTDNALRKFFDSCKNTAWFNNTIFIITADHMSQHSLSKYKNNWGVFAIPMMIYVPGNEKYVGFNDSTIVQQTDILPTVMHMVGSSSPYVSFGNDMFSGDKHFAFDYKDDTYILIEDGYYLQFDGEKSIGLFHILNDEFMRNNLVNQELIVQEKLENHIKAIIQNYTECLIDNHLTAQQ